MFKYERMLEKYLQEIGLSEREAQVYVVLLQMESASVIDVAQKTKINRSTMYLVLEDLLKKGLVTEVQIGKKMYYQAVAPERLETFIEKQKIELDEQSKRLKDIMPMLKSVQRESADRPIVKYYEGKDGIVSSVNELYEVVAQDDNLAYLVYPRHLIGEVFSEEENERFRSKRKKLGIRNKVIYINDAGDIPEDAMSERIRIDEKKYPLSCDISIYNNRVRISTIGKKLSSIFIENQDVAETLRSLFKLAFDNENDKRKTRQ